MDNLKIKKYLNDRGISDAVINSRNISASPAGKIVIPIFDSNYNVLFNKYRRNPESFEGPKYMYDLGAKTALYGIDILKNNVKNNVVVCEGELDALVLLSNNFLAVTSTGGAGTFPEEWAPLFENKNVYVCFDNDAAGRKGCANVCKVVRHAKVIPLPFEVKDVTDYFVKLKKSAADFRSLMDVAFELDIPPDPPKRTRRNPTGNDDFTKAKSVPIGDFIKINSQGFASCPFHNEKTASMKVDDKNRFYCFGCSKWGDVIDIVQQIYNLSSTRESVNFILKK